MLVDGPIFMFKIIISTVSTLKKNLLDCNLEEVNNVMSSFIKDDQRLSSKKNNVLPTVSDLIKSAQEISITLPDLTSS